MAEIELYRSPISYKKENGDEWDEVFEDYSYLYEDESDRIIEVRRHGRHNARDSSVNYEDFQRKVIKKNDLPDEAKKVLDRLKK